VAYGLLIRGKGCASGSARMRAARASGGRGELKTCDMMGGHQRLRAMHTRFISTTVCDAPHRWGFRAGMRGTMPAISKGILLQAAAKNKV
jgi:hypothetical protein